MVWRLGVEACVPTAPINELRELGLGVQQCLGAAV